MRRAAQNLAMPLLRALDEGREYEMLVNYEHFKTQSKGYMSISIDKAMQKLVLGGFNKPVLWHPIFPPLMNM